MADSPEVVIVGGGVVGACTAFELVERGVRTLLLERGDICSGASYGNAGWIFASLSTPLPGPGVIRDALPWLLDPASPLSIKPRADLELLRWLWRFRAACQADAMRAGFALRRDLALASLERHAALAKLDAIAGDFRQRGLLVAYRSQRGLRQAETEIEWLDAQGGVARRLTAQDLRARIPALAADLAGGFEFPMDAHLRPDTFVRSLIAAAEQRGLVVHRNTEVIGFEWARRTPVRVLTTRGDFTADEVILAAGAFTAPLARQLGLRIPIQAGKGYSISVERPARHPDLPVMLAEAHVAVTPFGDTLRFAGTLELGGLDLRIDRRRVEALRRAVRTYLPGLEPTPTREIWRGLRPMTPDDLPILGRPRGTSGVIIASGHGMDGMAFGPITGELIAQLASGEATRLDLRPFSPDRF